ncbi:MAG: hypothetical protein IJ228_08245 [Succinivibrio sp.]|nr:hypothetical protein [Succinivibrio sp.]
MRKNGPDRISILKKRDVAVDAYLLSQSVFRTVGMYEDLFGFTRRGDIRFVVTESRSAPSLQKQLGISTEQAQLIGEILDDLRSAMSDEAFPEVERGGGKWLEQPAKENHAKCVDRALALYYEASGTSAGGEGRRPARMINCLIRSCESLLKDSPRSLPDLKSEPGKLQAFRFIYARDALICVLALFAFEYAADILKRQHQPDKPGNGSGPDNQKEPDNSRICGSADRTQPHLTPLQRQERAVGTDHDDLPYGGRSCRRYSTGEGKEALMIREQKVPALLQSIYEAVRKLKNIYGIIVLTMPRFPKVEDV